MDEEKEEKKLGLMSRILGKDVSTIPCFRNTFLISISSGLVGGFAFFMYSSKPKKSAHVAYGTFVAVTFSYWIYCRYNWSVEKFKLEQMKGVQKYRPLYADSEGNVVNDDKKKIDSE